MLEPHVNEIGSLAGFTMSDECADAWAEVFIDLAARVDAKASGPDVVNVASVEMKSNRKGKS